MTADQTGPDDPGGAEDLSPRRPQNRPGLSQIAYRIGVHPSFLARMKHAVPRQIVDGRRPLAGLTARETADPAIAVLDAWAAGLDVLSFYSERIANEGYVGACEERRSMVELARAIGYELAPGVAASVHLAFWVEDSDDPYRAVDVPQGVQAMSVPHEKDRLPQVYETVEPILARAEWNAIRARTERPQRIALHWQEGDPRHGRLYLFDLENAFDLSAVDPAALIEISDADALSVYRPLADDLDLGAALTALQEDAAYNPEITPALRAVEITEIHLRGVALGLAPGGRMLAVGARRDAEGAQQAAAAPFRIVEVEADRPRDMTRVVLAPIGGAPESPDAGGAAPVRLSPPPVRAARLRIGTVTTAPIGFNTGAVDAMVRRTAWTGATMSAFLKTQDWPRLQLMQLIRTPPKRPAAALDEVRPGFHALRQTVGFFGNGAPRWESLAKQGESRGDPYPASWDAPAGGGPRTIWTDSQGAMLQGADAWLEREVDEIAPDQWALLETPDGAVKALRVAEATKASRADYAQSAKATGLRFRRPDGSAAPIDPAADDFAPFTFRTARAHVDSRFLAAAGAPAPDDLTAGAAELALDSLYLDLEPGRAVSISGERADAPGVEASETLAIAEVLHTGGVTRIIFETGPTHPYVRAAIRVNANVALATHGESRTETLGSGDAALANQAFALSKPPLTFVSAPTPSGAASTLTVRVDGVAWREVPSLLDAGPQDAVYQLRIDDDGTTRTVFGDGAHGRRLPTGSLNITAAYRAGIGPEGEAPGAAIIQLKTRPLGIRSVANPSPAMGAAARETLEDARERAPRSVKVLGRIVSLTDYADFARGFAGIGKAAACALWVGRERIAHLTVAPDGEGAFAPDAPTLANLRAAIELVRNPVHRVEIAPHAPLFFSLAARVIHDPAYLPEDVEAAARALLEDRFGHRARRLAQPVSAAEIVAALHEVAGVAAVDLDALSLYDADRPDAAPGLAAVLPARPARVVHDASGAPAQHAAELLTLLGAGVALTMEAADA